MCVHLPRLLVLLTALSTVFAGMPLDALADHSLSTLSVGSPLADGDDAASPRDASTEEEREEEESDGDFDLIADRAAAVGLPVHRFGRAAIAGAGSALRLDRSHLPIRGPPAA